MTTFKEDTPAPGKPVRRRNWIALALVAAAAAGAAYALRAKPAAPTAAAAVPVTVGLAALRDMPVWLSAVGTVTALNTVDLKVRVDGQLQKIAFVEGQEVAAGATLAQIDPRPLKALLLQAEATLQKDQATLANLKLDAARYGQLAEIGAGTTQSRDASKSQLAAQQASVAADAAAVETARLQLEYTTIKAPFGGRLGMREADAGAMVHASDTTGLVTLTQIEPITVLFSLPQDKLGALAAEQRKAALAVTAGDASGGRQLADGKLVFIDNQVDQSTGQIRLKASFANADRALWPGQLVTARLLLRTERGAVALPSRAILSGQNGNFVYVLNADNHVAPRDISAGTVAGGYTAVTAGLAAGERVVLDGQSRLAQGTLVAARAAAPDGAAAPAIASAAAAVKGQ
ncbi:MAG TPA: efflux RND transporter periplasmic adaptor subunit [Janthinobacterium sp.]|nr:efflux RND transporter periplasmic adaptor subunit [Janthinobacterium sp.]